VRTLTSTGRGARSRPPYRDMLEQAIDVDESIAAGALFDYLRARAALVRACRSVRRQVMVEQAEITPAAMKSKCTPPTMSLFLLESHRYEIAVGFVICKALRPLLSRRSPTKSLRVG
jgi:hypothetical protein